MPKNKQIALKPQIAKTNSTVQDQPEIDTVTETMEAPAHFLGTRNPAALSRQDVIYLQRVVGNQAVQRIIAKKPQTGAATQAKGPVASLIPDQVGVIARLPYTDIPNTVTWKDDSKLDIRYKRSKDFIKIDEAVAKWEASKTNPDLKLQREALTNLRNTLNDWKRIKQNKTSKRVGPVDELLKIVETKIAGVNTDHADELAPEIVKFDAQVAKGDVRKAQAIGEDIASKYLEHFVSIMDNRLITSKGDTTKWLTYYFSTPLSAFGFGQANINALANFNDFSWMDNVDADYIIEDFITPLKGKLGSDEVLKLFQSKTFMTALKAQATDTVYQGMVDDTPQLSVMDKALKSAANKGMAVTTDIMSVADEIFGAFVEGRGIQSKYTATTTGGQVIEMRKTNAVKAEAACHDLSTILVDILKSWSGDAVTTSFGFIDLPVMTKPLSTITRTYPGLIDPAFDGNVFVKTGKTYTPTGRIFFSAQPRSHTWLKVQSGTGPERAYDTLFGTIGAAQVASTEEEQFDEDPKNPNLYIGRTSGRRLIRDKKVYNTGRAYNFAPGYRLEPAKKK